MSEDFKHLECFVQEKDISEKELVSLIINYQNNESPDLHEQIVLGRMNFILNQSKKFSARYPSLEHGEVLSGIFDGVTRAIKGFKPNKNTKFSTYSIFWIKVFLTNAIIKKGSAVGINNLTYSKVKRLSSLTTMNENIDDDELLKVLKVSKRKLRELKAIKECMSNYSVHSDPYIEMQMELKLHENAREITYDKELIDSCINELDDRISFLIKEKYGLNGDKPKTLEEISSKMPITHQRVHQLIQKALSKLRRIYVKRTKDNE